MPSSQPKNWSHTRGDYQAMCGICGVMWPRSRLIRKSDGLLHCPDDASGRDIVECSRLNAESKPDGTPRAPHDGGGFDTNGGYTPL